MNKTYVWAVVIILILLIGAILYNQKGSAGAPAAENFGTYSYECDERVTFTMTPASDMSTIAIAPDSADAVYPPAVTLTKKPATSGVRYEGGGVVFTARGETITLGEGDSAINCSPVPNPDSPPFNFGD
ncbi:MAG: hypothetical protein AAB480_04345 [Patescibacteria group bacterium]